MKQEWVIHRQTVQQIDGQRRWDLAYQCLLKWATGTKQEQGTLVQEAKHESGDLRPGINPSASIDPDYRTTD